MKSKWQWSTCNEYKFGLNFFSKQVDKKNYRCYTTLTHNHLPISRSSLCIEKKDQLIINETMWPIITMLVSNTATSHKPCLISLGNKERKSNNVQPEQLAIFMVNVFLDFKSNHCSFYLEWYSKLSHVSKKLYMCVTTYLMNQHKHQQGDTTLQKCNHFA